MGGDGPEEVRQNGGGVVQNPLKMPCQYGGHIRSIDHNALWIANAVNLRARMPAGDAVDIFPGQGMLTMFHGALQSLSLLSDVCRLINL
jgi:hypothetical protein